VRPAIIAIDGPSASGKSSTGAAVARELGWAHLDTGALYRGLTLVALDRGSLQDAAAILESAEARRLSLSSIGSEVAVFLDGVPEDRIRTPDVTAAVSEVSAHPALRAWATEQFQSAARAGHAMVLDGRDIGTVVFPDAPLKVFLTAAPAVRARRRLLQGAIPPDAEALARETARLAARDRADSSRPVAPLSRAPDAIEVDTSLLGFEEQVARIVSLARAIWLL